MLFKLHGTYPPLDPMEAAQYGVRVIRVDIPRPLNEQARAYVWHEARSSREQQTTNG
jgi:hypothetical protein